MDSWVPEILHSESISLVKKRTNSRCHTSLHAIPHEQPLQYPVAPWEDVQASMHILAQSAHAVESALHRTRSHKQMVSGSPWPALMCSCPSALPGMHTAYAIRRSAIRLLRLALTGAPGSAPGRAGCRARTQRRGAWTRCTRPGAAPPRAPRPSAAARPPAAAPSRWLRSVRPEAQAKTMIRSQVW